MQLAFKTLPPLEVHEALEPALSMAPMLTGSTTSSLPHIFQDGYAGATATSAANSAHEKQQSDT